MREAGRLQPTRAPRRRHTAMDDVTTTHFVVRFRTSILEAAGR
jgi:hypothetical protein